MTMLTDTTTAPARAADTDHPALTRLAALDQRWQPARVAPTTQRSSMGYQPGLDGLRAVSVIAVILYHAGFEWLRGGFFGVEVFFVVSGFLITSLLVEERAGTGRVSLSGFWLRRARRLLPALAVLLATVAVWAAVFGDAEQQSQLRRDLPWSIFYVSNWGQIVGDVPYYSGDPPLLRHLWSLGVEEQWYLLWPLAFVAVAAWRRPVSTKVMAVLAAAVGSMLFIYWLHAGGPGPVRSPLDALDGVDRVNLMYLSTPTRAAGLLLGAATAFVWRPWRLAGAGDDHRERPALDALGGIAVGGLGCIFAVAALTDGYVYQWLLPLVSVLSLIAVMTVVHPWARGMRRVFSWRPLVEIGKRSYGLYLWHWPIFVIAGATDGDVGRVTTALVATVAVSELCYRYVEMPVRRGALGRWWTGVGVRRSSTVAAVTVTALALAAFYASVEPFDRAVGGSATEFTPEAQSARTQASQSTPQQIGQRRAGAGARSWRGAGRREDRPAPAAIAAPGLPITAAIVGDSQAHSLAVNVPDRLASTVDVVDGSLDGCSVHDEGGVSSARDFDNTFAICEGWQEHWAEAAEQADVALVVLGAWDVFDLETDAGTLVFGTPEWDQRFLIDLRSGIEAMRSVGAHVALLEVACMRPQDVDGAGVPALPERGDDARVAHVNELLRSLAGDGISFVEGPDAWCADEAIATDPGMRWDGVHVYVPGAELIFETITPSLLELAT
jgi:peptidoglycan/LPS O-acetylase OafA/YrhL